jgi:biopolymer transport protein ExbD
MRRFDTINVIPFIDIMLVLLAVVLTTATFIAEGLLEIELPESRAAADSTPETLVEVAIDRDGRFFLDGEAVRREQLAGRLGSLARNTPVTLRVDAGARFASFVEVVDVLKLLGMDRLTILTEQVR